MNAVMMVSALVFIASVGNTNAVKLDNSEINKRDKKNGYVQTADKQGTSESDIKISSEIRQALVKDKSFSIYAQNVKIITVNGEVIFKGPVRTIAEQKALEEKAKGVSGVSKVLNRTDVVKE